MLNLAVMVVKETLDAAKMKKGKPQGETARHDSVVDRPRGIHHKRKSRKTTNEPMAKPYSH